MTRSVNQNKRAIKIHKSPKHQYRYNIVPPWKTFGLHYWSTYVTGFFASTVIYPTEIVRQLMALCLLIYILQYSVAREVGITSGLVFLWALIELPRLRTPDQRESGTSLDVVGLSIGDFKFSRCIIIKFFSVGVRNGRASENWMGGTFLDSKLDQRSWLGTFLLRFCTGNWTGLPVNSLCKCCYITSSVCRGSCHW